LKKKKRGLKIRGGPPDLRGKARKKEDRYESEKLTALLIMKETL